MRTASPMLRECAWGRPAGRFRKAASRLDPDLAAVDLLAARTLLDAGNPSASLAAVDRFLARRADHAAAHLLRARALAASGMHEEAAVAFTRGIDLGLAAGVAAQPGDYLDRAHELVLLGDTRIDEAIRGLDDGAARLGGAVTLQVRAIEFETKRGNWTSALARLSAIEAGSNRKEVWIARRADVLARAGRGAEAAQACEEALSAIEALPARLRGTEATRELAAGLRSRLADLRVAGVDTRARGDTGQETTDR